MAAVDELPKPERPHSGPWPEGCLNKAVSSAGVGTAALLSGPKLALGTGQSSQEQMGH